MKIKFFHCLAAAGLLAASFSLNAQEAKALTPVQTQVTELVTKIRAKIEANQEKIQADKSTEADFADELKSFDTLIAGQRTADPETAAQIAYMKASLYVQIIKDLDKAKALIKQIKTDFPATKVGKAADQILASLEKQAASKKIQDALVGGAEFPDFAEKDLNGNPISVSALKGKVVLVDFWATWCGPCRVELPNVIDTYKKHHSEGFEIIGVSLDSKRDALESFLKDHADMVWSQFFDGDGSDEPNWKSKLAVKYGVESIPFAVLIGADGKIIGKDLRGDDLENAVAKAVAKK